MSITARLDLAEFETRLAVLKRPQAPIVRALNRSIGSGKTFAVRAVSGDMGLPATVVREYVQTTPATPDRLEARLYASATRVPLVKFKARGPEPSRGRPGGVRAALKGGAGHYPRAFIARLRNGYRGVFTRQPGVDRLPIVQLHGPSIAQSYGKVEAPVRARVFEQLGKNLTHEIEFALSR